MARSEGAGSGWRGAAVLGLCTAVLLTAATGVLFSVFMFYDDEGYVLLSLQNFLQHGGLYREVYTQYGPAPFAWQQLLHTLGVPVTHVAGRVLTLAIWAGAALACASLVGQATRSLALQVATLAAAFVYLWILASEPSHPGGLIVFLTALAGAAGYRCIVTDRMRAFAIAAGAITAVLLLTKINIGIFFGCSVIAWWALHHQGVTVRNVATWLLPMAAVALPFALMRPLLATPWIQTFASVFACSAVALLVTVRSTATPRTRNVDAAWGVAAAVLVGLAITAVVMARGTSLREVLDGVLLAPLRHPTAFSLRYLWPPGITVTAVLSLLIALGALAARGRHPEIVDHVVAILRLAAAAGLAINLLRYPAVSPDYAVFGWALPCVWLFLWPLRSDSASWHQARTWVGLLLLGQCLHVFPVPGSQIAWGTLLALPLAAIGVWEACTWLREIRSANAQARPRRMTLAAAAAILVAVIFSVVLATRFIHVARRYQADTDLRLPGAEPLRLPEPFSAALRTLVVNAAAHADVLFSYPGMFSFNLWSGVPTPTQANVTHWFSLLDARRQGEIIDALEARPQACVIVHREHIRFLTTRGLTPRGPLVDYIERHFIPAFRLDDYEFRVRRGRQILPYFVADLLSRAGNADPQEAAAATNRRLQFAALLPAGARVAAIEIVSGEGSAAPRLRLDQANARVMLTPLSARGEFIGPSAPVNWPVAAATPVLLSVGFDAPADTLILPGAVIRCRDESGQVIATARFRE